MSKYTYEEAVAYLLDIPRFTKKNNMEHTASFLDQVGNYRKATNVIHVAGTNGKGSVSAYLSGILTEAGYKTGMFTSPHLVKMNERFQINGACISDKLFLEAFLKIKCEIEELVKEGYPHPTFFECMVAMASVIFEREQVDYQIMETGLGGRLDATNIIEKPLAAVITSIGYDHMEYLGESLDEITGEKAGIIKKNIPVIFDAGISHAEHSVAEKEEFGGEICRTIEDRAESLNSIAYKVEKKMCKNVNFTNKYIDFYFFYEYDRYVLLRLNTIASYQIMNAAIAVKTILTIDSKHTISMEMIRRGVANVQWPGRMEWVTPNLLLDGAHNVDGMRQMVQTLCNPSLQRKPILLFSAVREKNYEQMIGELCKNIKFGAVVITQLKLPRAERGEVLASIFEQHCGSRIYLEKKVEEAYEKAESLRTDKEFLICTGSLYLVGEIKKILEGRQGKYD